MNTVEMLSPRISYLRFHHSVALVPLGAVEQVFDSRTAFTFIPKYVFESDRYAF